MRLYQLTLLSLGLLLAACAMVQPQTPSAQLATADAQFTALTRGATDLIQQGTIHGADAVHVQTLVHQGSDALDTAWTALGNGEPMTDPYAVLLRVNQALSAIIQQYGGSHG